MKYLPAYDNIQLQTDSGLFLKIGDTALHAGVFQAAISSQQLINYSNSEGHIGNPIDSGYDTVSDIFDFEIDGIETGGSVRVIIPLSEPVPTNAEYRKYIANSGWNSFLVDGRNSVSSAPGVLGVCPATGHPEYVNGLISGYYCIQLLIEDGGPNDSDLLANGIVKDPSALAVLSSIEDDDQSEDNNSTESNSDSSSGGGGGGSISISLYIILLGLYALRRRESLRN